MVPESLSQNSPLEPHPQSLKRLTPSNLIIRNISARWASHLQNFPIWENYGDIWTWKFGYWHVEWLEHKQREKQKNLFLYFVLALISMSIHSVVDRLQLFLNLSWIRVRMTYRRFNHLDKILHSNLAAKIGQGELTDITYNYSNPSKVNGKCVFESILQKK